MSQENPDENPDGSLNFEIVDPKIAKAILEAPLQTVSEQPKVELTLEEVAVNEKILAEKYEVSKPVEPKPEDVAKIEEIRESIKVKSEQVVSSPEIVTENKSVEESVEKTAQKKESAIESFLGEKVEGPKRYIRDSIRDKSSDNNRKYYNDFINFGARPSVALATGGMAAWIAAVNGVGVTSLIAGVPLMSVATVAMVSAGVAVPVIAGAVWGIRKIINSYKEDKARNELALN